MERCEVAGKQRGRTQRKDTVAREMEVKKIREREAKRESMRDDGTAEESKTNSAMQGVKVVSERIILDRKQARKKETGKEG